MFLDGFGCFLTAVLSLTSVLDVHPPRGMNAVTRNTWYLVRTRYNTSSICFAFDWDQGPELWCGGIDSCSYSPAAAASAAAAAAFAKAKTCLPACCLAPQERQMIWTLIRTRAWYVRSRVGGGVRLYVTGYSYINRRRYIHIPGTRYHV